MEGFILPHRSRITEMDKYSQKVSANCFTVTASNAMLSCSLTFEKLDDGKTWLTTKVVLEQSKTQIASKDFPKPELAVHSAQRSADTLTLCCLLMSSEAA